MKKTSKIVVFLSASVILAGAAFVIVSANRVPRPAPAPSVREAGEVRTVSAGRAPGRRPAPCPVLGVSAAVETVCGLDRKTAGSYPARIAAFRSIQNRRSLSPEDVLSLLGYIASTNDTMRADRTAGLKNEVLNLLRDQDPVPSRLVPLLVEMIGSGDFDATITDYCIQHLGAMWKELADGGRRDEVRNVFASAASRRDLPYAGTALYSLADERNAPPECRRKLRRLTVGLACDPSANRLARISAIQLAAQRGFTEVLPSVRAVLAESRPDPVLATVSVGALGCLGGPADVALLESLREKGGERLRPAVEAAAARLGKTLAKE